MTPEMGTMADWRLWDGEQTVCFGWLQAKADVGEKYILGDDRNSQS